MERPAEVLFTILDNQCPSTGPDTDGFMLYNIDLCCAWFEIRAKKVSARVWEIDWMKPRGV